MPQQVPMMQQPPPPPHPGQVPMQQMHQGQVPMQQVHPGQVPMQPHPGQVPMQPHPGQVPMQPHPGQVPMQQFHPGQVPPQHQPPPVQHTPMTVPLFNENAEDAPAVAMEYKVHVDPGKEQCYFQFVQMAATIYVLRGGDGMAGFAVRNPAGQLVHPYQWKASSEFQEVSQTGGYYGICVDNQFSRFAAKLVNLYITTFRYDQWEKFAQELKDIDVSAENCTQTLQGVDRRIQTILQLQQQSRGREARDYNLLLDNEAYVQYWSLAQCAVVIGCFVVQVFFVKKLFDTKTSVRGRI
nr:EOG090X0AV2 [Ilyocryptus agilis]